MFFYRCNEPCRDECKPCKEKCELQCCHSKCNKKCGEPCDPCVVSKFRLSVTLNCNHFVTIFFPLQEPCTLGCEHRKCKKRCSEKCGIDPCSEPCKKKLKCNHDCVGYCGDPCPPLCRICDKEELTLIFLGREDEPNARYIAFI